MFEKAIVGFLAAVALISVSLVVFTRHEQPAVRTVHQRFASTYAVWTYSGSIEASVSVNLFACVMDVNYTVPACSALCAIQGSCQSTCTQRIDESPGCYYTIPCSTLSNAVGQTFLFENSADGATNYVEMEPGCSIFLSTNSLRYIKLKNRGSLVGALVDTNSSISILQTVGFATFN